MAAKTFDEIYAALSAQEKTILDNLFAKEPELKKGWLRQDDFSRKSNELQAKQGEFEEAVAYKEKMEPWAKDVYDKLHSLEESGVVQPDGDSYKVIWTEQKTALEQQLREAQERAATGGDVDPKELDKIVTEKVNAIAKAAGGVTKEEALALYQAETKNAVEAGFKEREAKFNSETIPMVGGFSAAVAIVATHYEQESGKKWSKQDSERLYKTMSEQGKFDALEVESVFLEPIRAEKKKEADIEAEVQKRLAERGMPGGGGERFIPQPPDGGARGLLQKALDASESGDKEVDVRDAVRAAAVEGARELETAGKV